MESKLKFKILEHRANISSLFYMQTKSIPSFLSCYLFVSISSSCNPTGAKKRENKNIHKAPAAPGMQEAALSDLAQTTILN